MLHDEFNNGRHIDDIIERTICLQHNGEQGIACFYVFYSSKGGESGPAICNSRVKLAGFNGKISDSSLRQKTRDRKASYRG